MEEARLFTLLSGESSAEKFLEYAEHELPAGRGRK